MVKDLLKTPIGRLRIVAFFEGCSYLELYQDKNNSETFFTYSRWENDADLENYRSSDLFKNIWTTTKPMFRSKVEVWSVNTLNHLG